ncbi:MAG TPA: hypothetical protein V6D07_00510 [Trichocoleus sp.]
MRRSEPISLPIDATRGRLEAKPTAPKEWGTPGLYPLDLADNRDGWLAIPDSYQAGQPTPLILMLHGAGGNAMGALVLLQQASLFSKSLVLAVESRQQTWDIIRGHYGPDIRFIDQALSQTFNRYAVDAERLAIAGFSDGASYALSVGLTNGDLFGHILAFAPGFMVVKEQVGQPRIFMAHGRSDTVLPIDRCSRRLAPQLKRSGYSVTYQEFDGPHAVPAAIAEQGMNWFMTSSS